MMAKLSDKQKVDIIKAYAEGLVPMAELARLTGVTRQAIHKLIVKAGIERREVLDVSCSACGKVIRKHRCQVRKAKHLFCDQRCYAAFIRAGNGLDFTGSVRRQGSRIARKVVSKVFPLQEGHIVHHVNGNVLDNSPENLMVFACAGDHVRHHRGFDVPVLWTGELAQQ